MLRTLFWALWFLCYLVGCLPLYWKAKRLQKQGKKKEVDELARGAAKKWAGLLLKHIGVKLTVEGCENLPPPDMPVVFVSNHQSYIDIPVLLAGLDFPRALLARKEIGKVPLLRGWMDMLGCVYVDREDSRAAMAALRACEDLVKGGDSIIIFPEGTRSKSDTVGEYKGGAMRVAFRAKAPIVPLAISGSWRVLEGNGFKLKKADVKLTILPMIQTAGMERDEQKALPKKLEELVRRANGQQATVVQ